MAIAPPQQTSGASLSDLLSAAKNIVTAIATLTQTYLNVNGTLNAPGLTAANVVKNSAGRLAVVSVVVAGSAPGHAYDGAVLGATTKPLGVIPNTVGIYTVNIPFTLGLLVVPGSGQTVTVGYS